MMRAAPLRFLAVILGCWIGLRAALLIPVAPTPVLAKTGRSSRPIQGTEPAPPMLRQLVAAAGAPDLSNGIPPRRAEAKAAPTPPDIGPLPGLAWSAPAAAVMAGGAEPPGMTSVGPAAPLSRSPDRHPSRWSGSAWLLARDERGEASLAPAGTLGGSQAGGRLLFHIDSHWSLSARAYLPLRRPQGTEVSAGVDWRPFAAIPVSLLVERRQAIGDEGRSAFSITAYGGFSRDVARRVRVDGYAQAGFVGLRSRDAFVDGSVRAVAYSGRVEAGAGAWGAAQPGASRLDVGPSVSYSLPVHEGALRIEADWRFRIAGNAAPASGPALVVATDF